MKIRTDFITNSSSMSYIFGKESDLDIIENLYQYVQDISRAIYSSYLDICKFYSIFSYNLTDNVDYWKEENSALSTLYTNEWRLSSYGEYEKGLSVLQYVRNKFISELNKLKSSQIYVDTLKELYNKPLFLGIENSLDDELFENGFGDIFHDRKQRDSLKELSFGDITKYINVLYFCDGMNEAEYEILKEVVNRYVDDEIYFVNLDNKEMTLELAHRCLGECVLYVKDSAMELPVVLRAVLNHRSRLQSKFDFGGFL